MDGIKKIFKSKKGIAIETAILAIVVIFSLCFLITTSTLVGHYQVKIESAFILRDVELEQIGEDFIYSPESFNENAYEGFTCELNQEKTQLTAKYSSDDKEIILCVEIDGDGKVTRWEKWQVEI